VFYLTNTGTFSAMQELVLTLHVIARLKRVFSFDRLNALVLRGPAEDMALAEWLISELDAPPSQSARAQEGQTLAAHEYSAPDPLHGQNAVCVFHLKNPTADRDRREISSLLLAKARIPSRCVCAAPNAVVARGTASEIARAEQIIEEWDQPHAPASTE
jgi:type II secretory pathway component GspD/PulD (secretin)